MTGRNCGSVKAEALFHNNMKSMKSLFMVSLILFCPLSSIPNNDDSINVKEFTIFKSINGTSEIIPDTDPWIDTSISDKISLGSQEVRVTAITWSLKILNDWQHKYGAIERQKPLGEGEIFSYDEPNDGEINHRTFWVKSNLIHKLQSINGLIALIDAERPPESYDIQTSEIPPQFDPETVRSSEIHGANDAWEMGYTGENMVVAVADTGVDFGHPDLNGTQARVDYVDSEYVGWPLMLDHNSMYYWLVDGAAYPQTNTWYANTSIMDFDNDSNGILDNSGYNITGINSSLSGIYHLGEHPDPTLRNKAGGDVPILVVDDRISGLYETVYPDIDLNNWFGNETPMRPGEETSGRDVDGDGLWDISAGLVYWVADGINGAPYTETYASRHGYSNRIPGSGNLTLFMLESGNHGTLCASAVAAQGIVANGSIKGMAPNATISSIGNHYSGGHALDGWRFIAEGYDGDPTTPDQPNIGSFSFGYSSVDDSGSDGYSLYLDWLTRIYNENTSYAVAIGNGGHGFGTTKVPGAAHGIFSVGAFSSKSSDSWGQSAPWSNRGPNVVGRMDPDIVAVGWSATGDMPLNSYDSSNSAWTTWGGTSLATPIVAGLMALVAEAWVSNNDEYPKSQEFRDFVLSTSDDRGYEPFIQGGGWFNASRAISTLDGHNGTWWASPAQWNTGAFQGLHRDANINFIKPGESQEIEIEFTNSGESDILLDFNPTKFAPLEHNILVWNSFGNGSDNGTNDTWNGYQSNEPDLLIPLHISGNDSIQIDPETTQLRARATIEYPAFDPNNQRITHERVFLQIYRWTDYDSDGIFHNDTDNDGMVDAGEWTESNEMEEVTNWRSNGPQAEVRVGLPFEDASDGLILGVWRQVDEFSDEDPVRIEVDWTTFGLVTDDWITIIGENMISGGQSNLIMMNISIPEGTNPGLYQQGLDINSLLPDSEGNFTIFKNNWKLPIVTNIPWEGPFSLLPKPLDGNTSNQTLYTESWISGATRWNWRAESGDWRFLTIDWPAELDTGGMAILDVNWDDNPYTDIDVLWLSETAHGYSQEDTDAYGDSTFFIESRSINNHAGSGQHNWGTYTDSSQEVFAVPVSEGVHQMVLHTALHGVETNDNPLNISVGYIVAEDSGLERTVLDWSEGSGNDSLYLLSTIPLPVETVDAYGWNNVINFDNETAFDDGSNKMDASWWHNLSLENTSEISINMDAYDDADLDLYLFRDSNDDGNYTSDEEIARSWSGSSAESITVSNPEDGNYSIAVLGWSVPGNSVQFWLDAEIVGGDQLRVLNQSLLSVESINQLWPDGANELGGAVPSSVLEVNLDFDIPEMEGSWLGFVDILIEGNINFRLPYNYELVNSDPEITFVSPTNMTYTNELIDIQMYVIDIGVGFLLDDIECQALSNGTGQLFANSAFGITTNGHIYNITESWNYENYTSLNNITFREVTINSSVPDIEQWHDYKASVHDKYGNYDETYISIYVDYTAPELFVIGLPTITNEQNITIEIITEPNATFFMNNELISLDGNGSAQITLDLTVVQIGQYPSEDGYLPFYYVPNSNIFSFNSSDMSGNINSRNFQIIYDPEVNDVNILKILDQDNFEYQINDVPAPLNITNGELWINIPVDYKKLCVRLQSINSIGYFEECIYTEVIPEIFNESSGYPIEGIMNYGSDLDAIIFMDISELINGEYDFSIEIIDWANNSKIENWLVSFDTILPIVDWSLFPSQNAFLNGHIQNLSWGASEEVNVTLSLNGKEIYFAKGQNGYFNLELNRTGNHLFCFKAIDLTIYYENINTFIECKLMILDPSLYDSLISADINEGLVSTDSLEVELLREGSQEIRWYRTDTDIVNIIPPGDDYVILKLDLLEGMNDFIIEIMSLDEIDEYFISLERDSKSPIFSFSERDYRNSPLNSLKQIEGTCEAGLLVEINTILDNSQFICPISEKFSLNISIPEDSGIYLINGKTIDDANNEAIYSIDVTKQDWGEWVKDDIKNKGPMLNWIIVISIIIFMATALNIVTSKRRD